MESLTNEAPLPLAEIEQALLSRAVPKSYSRVVIWLRLLPTAAHEVRLKIEYHDTTRPDVTKDENPIIPSNERYSRVRMALAEKLRDFRVICPVVRLEANFQDGKLSSLNIVKAEEKSVREL